MGVVATRVKRQKIFMLHIHGIYPGSILVAYWVYTTYRLRQTIAGAQAEVAGTRAPVCPSLATPLSTTKAIFITTVTLIRWTGLSSSDFLQISVTLVLVTNFHPSS